MAGLDADYPNIRAALTFGADKQELVELYVCLAAALQYFWRQRSLVAEGLAWLNRAMADAQLLSLPGRARLYVALLNLGVNDHHKWFEGNNIDEQYLRVLVGADSLIRPCWEQGEEQTAALLMLTVAGFREYPGNEVRAEGYIRKAWSIFQRFGDLRGAGFAGNLLTRILIAKGDLESAQSIHKGVVDFLEQNRMMWALCDAYELQATIAQVKRDPTAKLHSAKRIAEIAEQEEFAYFLHNVYILLEGVDAVTACQMAEEFLERQRQKESSALLGLALHQLGRMQLNFGHYEQAASLLDEALQLWPQLGALHENGLGPHWSLIDRGQVARFMGDIELAIACFSESIRLFATSSYPAGGKYSILFRGQVRLEINDLDSALDDFHNCLRLSIENPRGWERFIVNCLVAIGEVARLRSDVTTAAKLFAMSAALLAKWSAGEIRGQPHEIALSERILAAAPNYRQDLTFEAAWREGGKLTLEEAIALALEA
jgi:tetratricopeptide (TPR) repeat protein